MNLLENGNIVAGFVPVNLATAANDGDWVNLKHYRHLLLLFIKGAGTAGEDPTLTLEQAKSNAGADSKALLVDTLFTKQGASIAAIAAWTRVTQTPANTYTDATSAEVEAIWAVELDVTDLDIDGGFTHVRGRVADVGNSAQIGCLLYILLEPRNPQDPTSMPSAID